MAKWESLVSNLQQCLETSCTWATVTSTIPNYDCGGRLATSFDSIRQQMHSEVIPDNSCVYDIFTNFDKPLAAQFCTSRSLASEQRIRYSSARANQESVSAPLNLDSRLLEFGTVHETSSILSGTGIFHKDLNECNGKFPSIHTLGSRQYEQPLQLASAFYSGEHINFGSTSIIGYSNWNTNMISGSHHKMDPAISAMFGPKVYQVGAQLPHVCFDCPSQKGMILYSPVDNETSRQGTSRCCKNCFTGGKDPELEKLNDREDIQVNMNSLGVTHTRIGEDYSLSAVIGRACSLSASGLVVSTHDKAQKKSENPYDQRPLMEEIHSEFSNKNNSHRNHSFVESWIPYFSDNRCWDESIFMLLGSQREYASDHLATADFIAGASTRKDFPNMEHMCICPASSHYNERELPNYMAASNSIAELDHEAEHASQVSSWPTTLELNQFIQSFAFSLPNFGQLTVHSNPQTELQEGGPLEQIHTSRNLSANSRAKRPAESIETSTRGKKLVRNEEATSYYSRDGASKEPCTGDSFIGNEDLNASSAFRRRCLNSTESKLARLRPNSDLLHPPGRTKSFSKIKTRTCRRTKFLLKQTSDRSTLHVNQCKFYDDSLQQLAVKYDSEMGGVHQGYELLMWPTIARKEHSENDLAASKKSLHNILYPFGCRKIPKTICRDALQRNQEENQVTFQVDARIPSVKVPPFGVCDADFLRQWSIFESQVVLHYPYILDTIAGDPSIILEGRVTCPRLYI